MPVSYLAIPSDRLLRLAKLYAHPTKKIVSYWTMGFNQHTRGVWVNGLMYNVHLLMGKISEPGNGPFSLTGQPSACGTAREVGTFAHRLPADYVVKKKSHRDLAEKIWDLPEPALFRVKLAIMPYCKVANANGWQAQRLLGDVQQ